MKVGLISGHGNGDCGACGYGYEEANETIRIVKALDAKLEACGIDTVVYQYERNAFKDCNRGLGLQVDFQMQLCVRGPFKQWTRGRNRGRQYRWN